MKGLISLAIAIGILIGIAELTSGCTPQQQKEAAVASASLQAACAAAMQLAPLAGPVAPYIIAGCATASGIAKLAADPSSVAWVESLIAEVRQPQ